MHVHTTLEEMPLFKGLTPQESAHVSAHVQLVHLPRKHYLFHAGDPAQHLYLVQAGVVKLSYIQAIGEEKIIHIAQEGDLFGHLFLGSYRHRVGTAFTLAQTTLWRLSEANFLHLIGLVPTLALNFIRYFADTQRQLLARLHATMHLSAPLRLLGTLHHMARHACCSKSDWFELSPYISQKDIANIACVNRSTANQCLQRWRTEGYITSEGRKLYINRTAIERVLREEGLEVLV